MTTRPYRILLAATLAALCARAGDMRNWAAETVPESGLDAKALAARLDAIEKETAGQPYLVTRTRQLVEIFDHARVCVATNDVFVDMLSGVGNTLEGRSWKRREAFRASRPELKGKTYPGELGGASNSALDTSHVCPDWESILTLGATGLAERARTRRLTATNASERVFLDSVVTVYAAVSRLCLRWADAADARQRPALAATLRANAAHAPRTLREALQWGLVYNLCQETEGEWVRSQGLFDRLYIRFYRDDLAAGRETRESAKALVAALFEKFYRQGHPNGKNIAFGGRDRAGVSVWNELTEIAFELHREFNRVNPKFTYRYDARTPADQLEKVAACLASGRTSIVFMNDDVGREMFMRRGKTAEDAADAVLIGCYEPGIMGREVIASMAGQINLAKPLEAALNGGRDFAGRMVGAPCALPQDGAAFEREYLRQLETLVATALAKSRLFEEHWTELNPTPLMSGAFRDAVRNARDAYAGGMKYNQSGVMCAGLGTVADALAAVRFLVDETRQVTMAELAATLKADWKGRDDLRNAVRRRAAKWGNNDDRADAAARRVYAALTAQVNATPNGHGGTFQAGLWSINLDMVYGKRTGATPDGRRAGETLSRNNVATAGCGTEGATALMLSNAKLDQADAPDGYILDVMLPASVAQGEQGAARLATMLRTYARLKGQSVQFNCFDSGVLRDAQAHPERYADLQVRVCGWNVRWNDLSKAEQEHFIATVAALER